MLADDRRNEILTAIRTIPCIETFGLQADALDEGYARLTARHDRRCDGVNPVFHGGMLATVADCAAWFAIVTVTGPAEPMATSDLHIRYLAACVGDVTAEARVLKIGRRLCPARVDLFDPAGQLVATATVCYARVSDASARQV